MIDPRQALAAQFPIISVPANAAQRTESMGTKRKFWYERHDGFWLCKIARPGTGEDWAEKTCAELAASLDLPHARYELANWSGNRAVITRSFVPRGSALIPGWWVLVEVVADYPRRRGGSKNFYRVQQHTLDLVSSIVGADHVRLPLDWSAVAPWITPTGVLCGYLMLDAWVGNTDRHHENWGFVALRDEGGQESTIHLAPSFDHASSLGCHEVDATRERRLATRDSGDSVEAYTERGRSAFFRNRHDTQPMSTFDAFAAIARTSPEAAGLWLDRLAEVGPEAELVVDRVPPQLISASARKFAKAVLSSNRVRLIAMRGELR